MTGLSPATFATRSARSSERRPSPSSRWSRWPPGLGLGAAAFSVIDTLLITPLRFKSPEQLVLVHATVPPEARDTNEITYLDAMRSRARDPGVRLARRGDDVCRHGHGARPARTHRGLRTHRRRCSRHSVCSPHWARLHGGRRTGRRRLPSSFSATGSGSGSARRADIIGQTLVLDDVPHTVVGVMPADFHVEVFNSRGAVYPPGHTATFRGRQPRVPGVSRHRAAAVPASRSNRRRALPRQWASGWPREYPDTNRGRTFSLQPLQADIVGPVRPALLLIAGLVALVLLIAAVNLMNLLLARAIARAREVAVRSALGAGAWRLARTSLIEGAAARGRREPWAACSIAQAILTALTTMPGVVLPRRQRNRDRLACRGRVRRGLAGCASIGVAIIPFLVHRRLHDTASLKTGHETAGRLESRGAIGDGRGANRPRLRADRGRDAARREPAAAAGARPPASMPAW